MNVDGIKYYNTIDIVKRNITCAWFHCLAGARFADDASRGQLLLVLVAVGCGENGGAGGGIARTFERVEKDVEKVVTALIRPLKEG